MYIFHFGREERNRVYLQKLESPLYSKRTHRRRWSQVFGEGIKGTTTSFSLLVVHISGGAPALQLPTSAGLCA